MRNTKIGRYFGSWLWILSIQYYLVQMFVAASWSAAHSYNWQNNTISDLANNACGVYGNRYVCSPRHALMNASFIILAVTMIGGVLFLRKLFIKSRVSLIGFGCMAVSAIGAITVGLFPENRVGIFHAVGAALTLIFGNLSMIILGFGLIGKPSWLHRYSLISGVIGLSAVVLFVTGVYLGLGVGGMERLAAYPQSIWMICFGTYLLLNKPDSIKAS